MLKVITAITLFVGVITFNSAVYIIPESHQVIITEFGKPIGEAKNEAGLYFKKPFVQRAIYVEKRILSWDGYPNQIPTKDKKYIKVDTTARWQIVDPLKFIQTVKNEQGAYSRLDTILDGATRNIISSNNLVEAVRNSNKIIEVIDQKREKAKTTTAVDTDIISDVDKIKKGREELSVNIKEKATSELLEFGIKLVDVQLKRISYEESVEQKVYERMISERNRIAEKIRSIGKGESKKIEGKLKKDLKKIESEAYKTIKEIQGHADATVLELYAKAYSKDQEFYEFMRSMEDYREVFDDKKELIISPNSKYFKYLQN